MVEGEWVVDKKKVITQIGDLIEWNCNGCTRNPYSTEGKNHSKRDNFCNIQCDIGKKLQELGKQITNPNKELKELALTKEDYLEMKKSGMTDKSIMKDSNIDHNKLYRLKGEWDLVGVRNTTEVSEQAKDKPKNHEEDRAKKDMEYIKIKLGEANKTIKHHELTIENLKNVIASLEDDLEQVSKEQPVENNNELKLIRENNAMKSLIRVWLEEEQA